MAEVIATRAQLRTQVDAWRKAGLRIALVPTMGALHEGHLDLVRAAKKEADRVVASIFVNPTQFAAHEDLDRYPRSEDKDLVLLASVGCDLVYMPLKEDMYAAGFATRLCVEGVSKPLEGQFRPHFFEGVATIVAKLFVQADPDLAFFGEKDWQQLQVVSRLALDLDLRVRVIGVPTRREEDGLAMSSRNAYLSPAERAVAPVLKRALDLVAIACQLDPTSVEHAISKAKELLFEAGFASIDYLTARHAHTLEEWHDGDPLRVLGAAWLGKTRLIDNRGS